jgi:hypothetical protein
MKLINSFGKLAGIGRSELFYPQTLMMLVIISSQNP